MGEFVVKDGAKQPKPPKRRAIWWRVLLAFLGGFLAFPLCVAGGTALVGTVFSTRQVVEMFGGDADQIIGDDYRDKTILQSVLAIIENASTGQINTLEDVNKISPMVQTTIESTFNDILKGILGEDTTARISWDDIKDKTFAGESTATNSTGSPLADEIRDQLLDQITLATFIQDAEDLKGVYGYFLYPLVEEEFICVDCGYVPYLDSDVDEATHHCPFDHETNVFQYYCKVCDQRDESGVRANNPYYTESELVDGKCPYGHTITKKDSSGNQYVASAINKFDTSNPYNLNYFVEGGASSFNSVIDKVMIGDVIDINDSSTQILQTMQNWKIGDMNSHIETLKVGDVLEIDDSSTYILQTMKDWVIMDMNSYINDLKIGDVLEIDESSTHILQTMKDWEINNMDGHIQTLKIGDVLDIDESSTQILQTMKDWEINNMNSYIETIKIGEVLEIDETSSKILQTMKDWQINNMNSHIETLTIGDLFSDEDIASNPLISALQNFTMNDLSNEDKIDGLQIKSLFDLSDADTLMQTIGEFYIGNLKGYEMYDNGTEVVKKLDGVGNPVKWEITNNIYVDDVLGDSDNQLLNSFKGKTLKQMMNTDLNSIKLIDIFDEDVYKEFTDTSAPNYAERHDKYNKILFAIMDNVRHKAYKAAVSSGYIGDYEDWLLVKDDEDNYINQVFTATISDITNSNMLNDLHLGDILEIEEGSLLHAYSEKTISELEDLDINDVRLADLIEKAVYVEGIDASKFNRVISSIMDHDREKQYEIVFANHTFDGTLEEWKAEGHWDATVGVLTDEDTIQNLYLKDVVEINEGEILNSFKDKKISELSSISVDDIFIRDLFEEDVYKEFSDTSAPNYAERHDKYNKIIGAIVENERHKDYEAEVTAHTFVGTYEQWLDVEVDGKYPNREFNAKASAITSQDNLNNLKLSDVIDNPNDGSVASNLIDSLDRDGATIGNLSTKIKEIGMGKLFGVPTDGEGNYLGYDSCRDDIPYVLYSLRDTPLNNLNSRLQTLTIKETMEIYTEDVYELIDDINALADGVTKYFERTGPEGHYVYNEVPVAPGESVTGYYILKHEKSSEILIAIKDKSVSDTSGIVDSLRSDILLGDIIEIDSSSPLILQKLENTPLNEIADSVDTFTLGDILDIDSSSPLILQKLKDTAFNSIGDEINAFTLGDIIDIDSTSPLILQKLKDSTLDDLGSDIDSFTLGDIVEIDGTSPLILQKLKDSTLSDIGDSINAFTLGDVIDIDSTSPLILKQLKDSTLSGIETDIKDFKLRDVMEVYKTNEFGQYLDKDGNVTENPAEYVYLSPIIGAMADVEIFDEDALSVRMDNLKFNEVFTYDDCESSNVLKALWVRNSNGDFVITDIASAMENVTLVDLIGNDLYVGSDPNNPISYTWWYLLTEETETELWKTTLEGQARIEARTELGEGLNYTVGDIDKIVDNMEYHIQNENLYSLKKAGFVTIEQSTLEMSIRTNPSNILDTTTKEIGEMTVSELVTIFEKYLAFYNAYIGL